MANFKQLLFMAMLVIGTDVCSAQADLVISSLTTTAPIGALPIPSGGFTAPLNFSATFNYRATQIPPDSVYHITDYHLTALDIDPVFNDNLLTLNGVFPTETVVSPGGSGSLTVNFTLPTTALNNAVDFPEGNFLELYLEGYLTYYTTTNDSAPVVPTPLQRQRVPSRLCPNPAQLSCAASEHVWGLQLVARSGTLPQQSF